MREGIVMMKRRINIFSLMAVMLFVCMVISCVSEIEEVRRQDECESILAEVTFHLDEMKLKSLAPSEEESSLKDVWIFQFRGNTASAELIAKPRYYSVLENQSVAQFTKADDCSVVFLANTHDPHVEWNDVRCLGDILGKRFNIAGNDDCYDPDNKDIISSGVLYNLDLSGASVSLNPRMSRIFARVDFSLTVSAAGLTPVAAQLCNVPKVAEYVPHDLAAGEIYPQEGQSSRFDYKMETISGNSAVFHWYMPRNEQGQTLSSDQKSKNESAPTGATYIKVLALNADNVLLEYRLYPGADMIKDFNLKPNHYYSVALELKTAGNPDSDSRVNSYKEVVNDEEASKANSFMVKSSPYSSSAKTTLSFYPHSRINQYWVGYKNTPTMQISASTSWTASLIWQDAKGLVMFVDDSGNEVTSYSATGRKPLRIAVANNSVGNALVAVRNSSGVVMWSWHIWVTDYQPECNEAPQTGKFIYSVNGGVLHRYADVRNVSSYWTSPDWYHDEFIMDRNLGAHSADYPKGELTGALSGAGTMKGVLSYQWGRKDPFLKASVERYDINGNALSGKQEITTSGVATVTAIANPDVYYGKTGSAGNNWSADAPENSVWNDVNLSTGAFGKSIFDPCPKGWAIPFANVWRGFVNTRSQSSVYKCATYEESTYLEPQRDEKLRWNYNGVPGGRYWPAGYDVPETPVFFPAVGGLHSGNYNNFSDATRTVLWAAERPAFLDFCYPNYWVPVNGATKAFGFPVRCISYSADR